MAKKKRPTLKDYLRTGVVHTIKAMEKAAAAEVAESVGSSGAPEAAAPMEPMEATGNIPQEQPILQSAAPEPEPVVEPESRTEPELESELTPEAEPEPRIEPEPEAEPAVEPVPEPDAATMDDFLALLTSADRAMWEGMLQAATDVSRIPLDLPSLREDFRTADRERFTYYLLSEEGASLSPVRTSVQIREPLRCVLKWDEMGAATLYESARQE